MSSAEDWRPLLRNALVTELERTPSALTFRLRLVRQPDDEVEVDVAHPVEALSKDLAR